MGASPILLETCPRNVGGYGPGHPAAEFPERFGTRCGRVRTLLTHGGTCWKPWWSRARYCEGVSPTISVNRELNEPSDEQPTVKHACVTDAPSRKSAFARSMRRVIRYAYGVSP